MHLTVPSCLLQRVRDHDDVSMICWKCPLYLVPAILSFQQYKRELHLFLFLSLSVNVAGMAITNTLLAIASKRPATARYVVWSRIDQKTCVKSISAANLQLIPVEQEWKEEAEALQTDVYGIQKAIESVGPEQVACVVTTTSCFAPRNPDACESVARLCNTFGVAHLINNAYGVQSRSICAEISRAWRRGRVDAVVQSTDKNFMVPVGGSMICEGMDLAVRMLYAILPQ